MKNKPIPQPSLEEIKENAKLFNSRCDWRYKGYQYYKWAKKLGIRDECCSHMPVKCGQKEKWNKETILASAKKYTYRQAWRDECSRAAAKALELGIYEECCAHMKYIHTECTLDEISSESLKYDSISDWRIGHPRSYNKARDMGIRDLYISHMSNKRKKHQIWSVEELYEDARKYKTKTEWRDNSVGAPSVAARLGIYDKCTEHMEALNNCFEVDKGVIYGYFFYDDVAYIGQTIDPKSRIISHLNKGPVSKKIKTGIFYEYRILEENIPFKDMIKKEQQYIDLYKTNNWNLLNTKSAGSRGSIAKVYWSKEKILNDAKRFITRSEWAEKSPGGYNACRKRNLMEVATAHMKQPPNWNKANVLESAKAYQTRAEWRSACGGAVNYAIANGFHEEACKHMKILHRKWTDEGLLDDAKKYNTITEWMNLSRGAYDSARARGIFDKCTSHMQLVRKVWSNDDIKEDAKRFDKKTQWARASGSAYNAARKRGILKECCKHMINQNLNYID